jgi:diguanylate cyclase (GGDEF)-like protein
MLVILVPAGAKFLWLGTTNFILLGALTLSFAGFLWALVCSTARHSIRHSEAHAALQQKSAIMEAIIDHFPGGIGYFDSAQRAVVFNEPARAFLSAPDACFAKGPPHLSDLISASQSVAGSCMDASQELLNAALVSARTPYHFERTRPDGMVLDVRGAPAANGGFITTYLDVTERSRSQAQILHLAEHDPLTDFANRTKFHAALRQTLSAASGAGRSFALLVFDLDRFKEVNDTFGHPIGDKLLQLVAQRARGCVHKGDLLARLGGDEFAIVANSACTPVDAAALAERLCAEIRKIYCVDGLSVSVGVSIGIAMGPGDGQDLEELAKNADLALYRAKAHGGCGYVFYEGAMDADMRTRRALEADLSQALSRDEFELYYQPLLDLETFTVSGFEALLRWHRKDHGLVSPATFIPLAEETGMIIPIGDWALQTACREALKWPAHVKVCVNLSPAQLKRQQLVQSVAEALHASGLAPERLELEITETVMLCDSDDEFAKLQALRALGVRIAIDDFGTGYSSLNNLRRFEFDKIKIDKSFVQEGDTGKAAAILHAITGLGHQLGLEITAEGIETADQLEAVRREGCTQAQGFHIARPVKASDVARVLALHAGAEQHRLAS